MALKRIIPCLDVKNGETVKGIRFQDLKALGNPSEMAGWYAEQGADELVFLDISATLESRNTQLQWVSEVAANTNIPFTVGGGISTVGGVYELLRAGADKVCVNSAAIKRPQLLDVLSREFGAQCIVLAVDASQINGIWKVFASGGTAETQRELFSWCEEATERGAGEVLFTSIDHDGIRNGFAFNALNKLSRQLTVPVIASGGAGAKEHFFQLFTQTDATGALAASIFHYGEIPIDELKSYLINQGIPIRPTANLI